MRVTGVICEYNPFHNGHRLHLRKARLAGADYIVCAMSGPFVQRGDVAVCDKWSRARSALECGADAVFELPALFALRAAPDFAFGGVALLAALGADTLAFGCEQEGLALLEPLAAADGGAAIKDALARGESYPRAVGGAFAEAPAPGSPNLTLGAEYLRSIRRLKAGMEPLAIPRDVSSETACAPASRVRQWLAEGDWEHAAQEMPCTSLELTRGQPLRRLDMLTQAILYRLRTAPPAELADMPGMGEGLENRLIQAAQRQTTLDGLLSAAKCKRYTMARLRRAVCAALTGMSGELARACPTPPYARLLGMRRDASPLLRRIQDTSAIPIITKTADAERTPCLLLDMRAQDIADMAVGILPGRDLKTPPVIV